MDEERIARRSGGHDVPHDPVVACTGHRPDKLGGEFSMQGPWSDHVRRILRQQVQALKPSRAVSGMAQGVDLLWAVVALEVGTPLTAAIPFHGWSEGWARPALEVLQMVVNHPLTTVHVVTATPKGGMKSGASGNWRYHARNRWMVDNCHVLLGVWDGSAGGTASCIKYARDVGRKIVYLDPRPTWPTPVRVQDPTDGTA